MRAELIGPGDPRWAAMLGEAAHDVHHLPGYVALAAEHEGGEPAALHADGAGARLLVPLVVHRLPDALEAPAGWRDAKSPYGYASPLIAGDPAGRDACARAAAAAAREAGLVSAALRLHPLLPPAPGELFPEAAARVRGEAVVVPLDRPLDAVVAERKPQLRADVRRLRRDGWTSEMGGREALADFVPLYAATMRRLEAAEIFHFPARYFDALAEALGERLHVALARSPEGDVGAAALFTTCGGIVQYLLAGTSDRHAAAAPSKLLLDHAVAWAHGRGERVVNLGGGRGGAVDSLFAFKARFSPHRRPLVDLGVVFDPDRFAALERRWCARATPAAASATAGFPSYRRSLVAS